MTPKYVNCQSEEQRLLRQLRVELYLITGRNFKSVRMKITTGYITVESFKTSFRDILEAVP